jgi:hypothetical protein
MLTNALGYVASWAARVGAGAAGWRSRRVPVSLAAAVLLCLGTGCGLGIPGSASGQPKSGGESLACDVQMRPLGPKDGPGSESASTGPTTRSPGTPSDSATIRLSR